MSDPASGPEWPGLGDPGPHPDSPAPGPSPSQPMALGLVIDVAARIMRRHWSVLVIVSTLLVGPAALLSAAAGIRFDDVANTVLPELGQDLFDPSVRLTVAEFERLGGAFVWYLLATVLAGALGTLAAVAFSAVAGADRAGRPMEAMAALRVCLRRGPSILAVMIATSLVIVALIAVGAIAIVGLVGISGGDVQRGGPGVFAAMVVGVALFVGVVYLTVRWALAVPVLAMEDVGWREALRRTWHLSADNVWRTLAVVISGALVTAIAGAVVSQLLAFVLVDLLAANVGLDLDIASAISVALATLVVAPIAAVLVAVLYFDLRARRDGPMVEEGPGTG